MELGFIAVVISIFLLIYSAAVLYILTRYLYRSITNYPRAPYRLQVVIDDGQDCGSLPKRAKGD